MGLATFSWLVLAVAAAAQTPGKAAFEAASVRPASPNGPTRKRGGPGTNDPGRFSYERATLSQALMAAYDVEADEISGPGWIESDRFDIQATVPRGTSSEEFRHMLQDLLVERFSITLHHESKDLPVYELVVAKNGPKLKRSSDDYTPEPGGVIPEGGNRPLDKNGFPILQRGEGQVGWFDHGVLRNSFRRHTMAQLAVELEQVFNLATGAPVGTQQPHIVDKAGLDGEFDFTMEHSITLSAPGYPASDLPEAPAGPSLFTALEQQLGLKLEKKKESLDVIVIDRAIRIPVEN